MKSVGKAAVLSLVVVLASGCNRDKLAGVNGHRITTAEFRERYEKYLDQSSERDNILTRKKVLTNMVNEQLIFADLHRQGFDADQTFHEKMQEVSGQALLDAYARRVSVDTMTVSEQELQNEFRAYNSKVTARFLYGKTKDDALRLRDSLEHGATFEALAKKVFDDPGLANSGGSLGTFGWGEMDPELAEVAFSIPVGSVSEPIELRMGYSIVKVDRRIEIPLASVYDYAKVKTKLERAIRQRKTTQFVKRAADAVSGELSPVFNQAAVDTALANWSVVLDDRGKTQLTEQSLPFPKDVSAMTLMSLKKGGTWTLGRFMQKVGQTRLYHRKRVKTSLDVEDMAVGLATQEVLLAHAKDLELEKDSGVVAQIKSVRDGWLLERWAKSIQDTVGRTGWNEDSLRAIFAANRKEYMDPPMVNVAEILTRSKPEADEMLKSLKRGEKFSMLAKKYSIRTWARERGGELGFNTKASFGVLGEKFFKAKIGQVVGPEFVDPYYGVFRILARKEGREKTYGESRDEIMASLLPARKALAFATAVQNLRQQARIETDIVALGNVVVEHK